MPPPVIGGSIKRWSASDVCLSVSLSVCLSVCLTSVCLSVAYIGPKSRTKRRRKTKIGIEVVHVTRDSETSFKVKRPKVKVTRPHCSPPCWRVRQLQRLAMETCWPWETATMLPSVRPREALRRPRGQERGGGISWRPPAYSFLFFDSLCTCTGSDIEQNSKGTDGIDSGSEQQGVQEGWLSQTHRATAFVL